MPGPGERHGGDRGAHVRGHGRQRRGDDVQLVHAGDEVLRPDHDVRRAAVGPADTDVVGCVAERPTIRLVELGERVLRGIGQGHRRVQRGAHRRHAQEVALDPARRDGVPRVAQRTGREIVGNDDRVDKLEQRPREGIAGVARGDGAHVHARRGEARSPVCDGDIGRRRPRPDLRRDREPRCVAAQVQLCGAEPHGGRDVEGLHGVARSRETVAPESRRAPVGGAHDVHRSLVPGGKPPVGGLEFRHAGAGIEDRCPGDRGRRDPQRLHDLRRAGPPTLLRHRRHEAGRQTSGVRGGHAGATLNLVSGVPARHRGECHPRRQHVRFVAVAAARAEPGERVGRRGHAGLRRARKDSGIQGPNRQGEVRGPGKAHGRESRPVVAGADREHHVRVSSEESVDERVDERPSFLLVAHAEAHIEHQGEVALGGETSRVLHRPHHRAVHRDAAARVVGDLERQQLRAGSHPVESLHIVEVVPRGDAGDVSAVAGRIEHQVEDRRAGAVGEVGRDGERAAPQGDRLATLPVVVQRRFVLERAVEVRVEERDPAIHRLHHDDREFIGVVPIAVHIGRGELAQRQLAEHACIPPRTGREAGDPPGPHELLSRDRDHAVAGRGDGSEDDPALPGKIAQVEELGRPGSGGDEASDAGIHPRVQDPDDHAAAVIGRMRGAELVHARGPERHEPRQERERRRHDRLRLLRRGPTAVGGGGGGGGSRCRGGLRRGGCGAPAGAGGDAHRGEDSPPAREAQRHG